MLIRDATGPLDKEVGDKVSTVTRMRNVYGLTECGWVGRQLETDPDAWDYVCLSASDSNVEYHERSPGSYEIINVRKEGWEQRAIWFTRPEDCEKFPTKDLWRKHPTKPNHWFYVGRTDDLIVYKNTAKYNPLAYEEELRQDPLIRFALFIGTNREQSALLIELEAAGKEMSLEDALNKIWPAIEKANSVAPKHAVVEKTHILFEKPEKPLLRSSKGTVQKLPSQRLYKDEIDALYEAQGDERRAGTMAPTKAPNGVINAVNGAAKVMDGSIHEASGSFEALNSSMKAANGSAH